MARHWKIIVALVVVLLIFGIMTLPSLLRSVLRLQTATVTEEQARRAINQPTVTTPTDALAAAQLYWGSPSSPGTLAAVSIQLPLSADPVQRSRQVLTALIAQAPATVQRTLPGDTELLAFYLLPDGVGVADFSESLATETPSGILSEQAAIDSIVRTLAANVPAVHSLKILIHGQEADTLAGHIDLAGFFPVTSASGPGTSAQTSTNGPPSPQDASAQASAPSTTSPPARQ